MIQRRSALTVADNSGAKKVVCIGIPGRSNRKVASIGDTIVIVVKGAQSHGLVKDHQISKAVVIRTAKEVKRRDGSYIRFDDNAAVLVSDDGLPIGSRIFGPVARELRDRGYNKIISLASEVW
jgi:large subunit ribosomal protein L14